MKDLLLFVRSDCPIRFAALTMARTSTKAWVLGSMPRRDPIGAACEAFRGSGCVVIGYVAADRSRSGARRHGGSCGGISLPRVRGWRRRGSRFWLSLNCNVEKIFQIIGMNIVICWTAAYLRRSSIDGPLIARRVIGRCLISRCSPRIPAASKDVLEDIRRSTAPFGFRSQQTPSISIASMVVPFNAKHAKCRIQATYRLPRYVIVQKSLYRRDYTEETYTVDQGARR